MTKQLLCPKDNTILDIQTRFEIEVDVCPKCRGIWLDRDELDKILSASRWERPQKTNLASDAVDAAATLPAAGPGASQHADDAASSIADFFGGLFS